MKSPQQFHDGRATSLGLVILGSTFVADAYHFQQGEWVVFRASYRLLSDIGRPGHGLEIRTAEGWLVGGASSFLGSDLPDSGRAGQTITFEHRLCLALAPGRYDVTIALGSRDPRETRPYTDPAISHQAFFSAIREHCRLPLAASFQIIPQAGGKYSHFGLVRLEGETSFYCEE